ncbi:MAG: ATP synthase F1 subunit gamma [Bacteroidetes bacterium]|nr:ATP synthase F1 subunit gamma [Bacteroidota bacterium]
MANLKEVRLRITSVNSTQQITKAMKMVSAAKLRRAQNAITQLRPYANKLRDMLENLSSSSEDSDGGQYAVVRPVKNVLIIAVSSNRGLAGAFNSNIMRTVNRLLADEYKEQVKAGGVKVLAIGKKVSDFYSKNTSIYAGHHNDIYADLTFVNVSAIAEKVMKDFADAKYDRVIVVYNQFKNAAVQYVMNEQLMPIQPPAKKESKMVSDYIFEPSKSEIVLELIPKSIKTQLYKEILDSHASEHGARMTAMNKATENAGEMLKELRLTYNKARQASITNEILEIVAGAEALNG